MTRQRVVILVELRNVDTHPTADEVYAMVRKRMLRVSLGAIYRTASRRPRSLPACRTLTNPRPLPSIASSPP